MGNSYPAKKPTWPHKLTTEASHEPGREPDDPNEAHHQYLYDDQGELVATTDFTMPEAGRVDDAGTAPDASTLMCEWAGDRRHCPNPATGYMGGPLRQHPLCDDHLRPECHPPVFRRYLHPGEAITTPCEHVR